MTFFRRAERVTFRPAAPSRAAPDAIGSFLAEVFADLDARPRPLDLELDFSQAPGSRSLDLKDGEVVLRSPGVAFAVLLRRRWLAEHPVPLPLRRRTRLRLVPTDGNRIRVRRPAFLFPL